MMIRGAKVHNLKNIDAAVPLGEIVGIAGVSGSSKSSLALHRRTEYPQYIRHIKQHRGRLTPSVFLCLFREYETFSVN